MTLIGPGGSGKTRLALEAAAALVPSYDGWGLLGRARRPPRARARHRDDLPDARRQGRPRRAHRRSTDAPARRQPRAGDRRGTPTLRASQRLPQPHPPRHLPRAPTRGRRGRVPDSSAGRARRRRPLLRAVAARAHREVAELCGRLDNLPLPSSSPPRARRRSPRLRSSSAFANASTSSKAVATPIRATRPCAPPSSGRTNSSLPTSNSCSVASRSLQGVARSRPPKRSAAPTPTPFSRSSRRACSASPTSATPCWRRSASTHSIGSMAPARQARCGELTPSITFGSLKPSMPRFAGRTQQVLLEQLDRELANVRVALAWLLESAPEQALSLTVLLDPLWSVRGRLREGASWYEEGLARAQAADSTLARERSAGGWRPARMLGGEPRALMLYEEGLLLETEARPQAGHCRRTAQPWPRGGEPCDLRGDRGRVGIASALHHLGGKALESGDYSQARELSSKRFRSGAESQARRSSQHRFTASGTAHSSKED